MSQHDPPLWVRAVAAGLLVFATWWLLNTGVLRDFVGDSVAALALLLVAIPVLRGMHLPLRIWPEGPWRREFRPGAVILFALGVAAVLLVGRQGMSEALAESVDVGTFALVAVGAVFWGFGLAMVKQRTFVPWFAIAAALAMLPPLMGLLLSWPDATESTASGVCIWSVGSEAGPDGEAAATCGTAFTPAFLVLFAVALTSKLVTEELAFRRLLMGCTHRTGLVWVFGAAVVAAAWYWVLSASGIGSTETVVFGGIAAVAAGCVYALSCSLMVSTVFSATLAAGMAALGFAQPAGQTPMSAVVWTSLATVTVLLSAVVARRNGFRGTGDEEEMTDAAGD